MAVDRSSQFFRDGLDDRRVVLRFDQLPAKFSNLILHE